MQHLTTQGSPAERGHQQGVACAALARPWFERTLAAVRRAVAVATVEREVAAWRRRMERVYPEGHAECCGIAAGMFTDFRVLFAAAEKRFQYSAGWPDYADTGTVYMTDLPGAGRGGTKGPRETPWRHRPIAGND